MNESDSKGVYFQGVVVFTAKYEMFRTTAGMTWRDGVRDKVI